MPELPEVETICIGLRNGSEDQPSILGRRIEGTCILWERTIQAPTISEFEKIICGQEIQDISRRGKYILLHLEISFLIIHLRMSGDLYFRANCQPIAPHDRILFEFKGGGCLVFNDTRKFGRIWLVQNPGDVLGKLGPEPFNPDLTGEAFHKMLLGHNTPIKKLILDQSFLAGIGNIYADEGLFGAKIHPLTISSQINIDSAEILLSSLRMVLQEGIRHHGSSIDWVYKGGDFQNYFRVYKRTGLPCRQCGTPIERILVGQRSTHFCPKCQHL
jgi:formamidopyrimidine-DNA glycosylase